MGDVLPCCHGLLDSRVLAPIHPYGLFQQLQLVDVYVNVSVWSHLVIDPIFLHRALVLARAMPHLFTARLLAQARDKALAAAALAPTTGTAVTPTAGAGSDSRSTSQSAAAAAAVPLLVQLAGVGPRGRKSGAAATAVAQRASSRARTAGDGSGSDLSLVTLRAWAYASSIVTGCVLVAFKWGHSRLAHVLSIIVAILLDGNAGGE
eukprot:COSAG05_NODE_715_length_7805_cov_5.098235_9_plen_206_part_00